MNKLWEKTNYIEKVFTAIIVLLPALNVYKSVIPSVELGTLLLIITFIIAFFKKKMIYMYKEDSIWLLLLFLFLVCTLFSSVLLNYNSSEYKIVTFRFLKICVIIFILITQKDLFDFNFAIKILQFFSIFAAVFLFIQTILYYSTGTILIGVYMPLASAEGYSDYNFQQMYQYLFRPTGIFFEPAHFCSYEAVYLSYLLLHPSEKYRTAKLLIIILGFLLSTSGTGYIILLVCFLLTSIIKIISTKFYINKKKVIITIAIIAIFLVIIFFFSKTNIWTNSFSRLINEDGTLGTATTGRLQSGALDYYVRLSPLLKVIGCGFGYRPTDVYFSSFYSLLYGDGILGILLFGIIVLIYFMRGNNFQKILCIEYVLLMIGTGVFNFASLGLYFVFICYKNNYREVVYDNIC